MGAVLCLAYCYVRWDRVVSAVHVTNHTDMPLLVPHLQAATRSYCRAQKPLIKQKRAAYRLHTHSQRLGPPPNACMYTQDKTYSGCPSNENRPLVPEMRHLHCVRVLLKESSCTVGMPSSTSWAKAATQHAHRASSNASSGALDAACSHTCSCCPGVPHAD